MTDDECGESSGRGNRMAQNEPGPERTNKTVAHQSAGSNTDVFVEASYIAKRTAATAPPALLMIHRLGREMFVRSVLVTFFVEPVVVRRTATMGMMTGDHLHSRSQPVIKWAMERFRVVYGR
jgi:hypothetical protein